MADVQARSPLAGRGPDLARLGAREVAFAAQLSVRTRTPEAFGLPREPNTWASLGVREALWLGPDEWLVVRALTDGEPGREAEARSADADGLEGAASLVDVSANRVAFDLARGDGRDPRTLLEQGCSIDLDPRAWREGSCAQTLLALVPVILQERGDAVRIFMRPSYGRWLLDWLLAASA